MNKKSESALVIFAKSPVPGHVKTRLTTLLSPADAAMLYRFFTESILQTVVPLEGVHIYVASSPSPDTPYFRELQKKHHVSLIEQGSGDLGARLVNVTGALFEGMGYCRVVVIGTDSPTLPLDFIERAFALLVEGSDVVLGPAVDGGYYLIGQSGYGPEIFDNIPWSTENALEVTIDNIKACRYSHRILPYWYDIDTPSDLIRLKGIPYVDKILTDYRLI